MSERKTINTADNELANPNDPEIRNEMTTRQAGRLGGQATLQKHGRCFFREIGRRGGQKTASLYSELLRERGWKGGRPKRPVLPET